MESIWTDEQCNEGKPKFRCFTNVVPFGDMRETQHNPTIHQAIASEKHSTMFVEAKISLNISLDTARPSS